MKRTSLPRDPAMDSTLALVRNGYGFASERAGRLSSDIFATRILGKQAIMVLGMEAAGAFYQPGRFTRKDAMPTSVVKLLQDFGSVQMMEGETHSLRKEMFLNLLWTKEGNQRFEDCLRTAFRRAFSGWKAMDEVRLQDAIAVVLTEAALEFCGVDSSREQVDKRARDLVTIIEGTGSIGYQHLKALLLRRDCERWAARLVHQARSMGDTSSPLGTIAHHRDHTGAELDTEVAAVELLNVIRPMVAIGRFIVFAALALYRQPEWHERFRAGELQHLVAFAEEVRRFYPFFPLIGGKVLQPFTWRDYPFESNEWVLLDIYASNHDARFWTQPECFDPMRKQFQSKERCVSVAQGGGDPWNGHRCPGEQLTVVAIAEATRMLTQEISWTLPEQDLTIDLRRIPAGPQDRLAMHFH